MFGMGLSFFAIGLSLRNDVQLLLMPVFIGLSLGNGVYCWYKSKSLNIFNSIAIVFFLASAIEGFLAFLLWKLLPNEVALQVVSLALGSLMGVCTVSFIIRKPLSDPTILWNSTAPPDLRQFSSQVQEAGERKILATIYPFFGSVLLGFIGGGLTSIALSKNSEEMAVFWLFSNILGVTIGTFGAIIGWLNWKRWVTTRSNLSADELKAAKVL